MGEVLRRSRAVRVTVACAVASALALLASGCASVPITGRQQVALVSDAQVMALSYQQYDEFLAASELSQDAEATGTIRTVGLRIQHAVESYFAEQGNSDALEGYAWEFNLVVNDQVNAWCMPGGKVVFYTGILPYFASDADVAVVMGHEVAHAVAEHGAERMSQQMMQQMGAAAVEQAVRSKSAATRELFASAYALGSQLGAMLPYSRLHESEADHIGLILMAMAGYDPRTAPLFWQRMAQAGGDKPPEFLSTHPADETRVRQLNERMPEAMQYYRP
jgi:predicted Zn-dependent protease